MSGKGPGRLLCLHGFGESAAHFEPLADWLPDYTLVSIDLPWHGETQWREGLDMPVDVLLGLIDQIPELRGQAFGILGFSMGGRIGLSLLQPLGDRVEQVILLAPDGLRINPWYRLATESRPGNRLFRQVMSAPGPFRKLLHLGNRLGIVNDSIMKFVERYVNDPGMRELVYRVWTTLRRFSISPAKAKHLLRERGIPLVMIFGRYDRIIPPSLGLAFIRGWESGARLEILDTGHLLLHAKALPFVAEALNRHIRTPNIPPA